MTPAMFIDRLAGLELPATFNPWHDRCAEFDRSDAAARRRRNLQNMLEAAIDHGAETMWIARDLGYRGGRRTGIPLTDEVHLRDAAALMGDIKLEKATQGPVVAERTAAVVWQVLRSISSPVVLWNVFPYHPHEEGKSMSNRCHTRAEREMTWSLLEGLIAMINPREIIAIGRDAQMALSALDKNVIPIRHPSYGGQREFISGLRHFYGLTESQGTQSQDQQLPFEAYAASANCALA